MYMLTIVLLMFVFPLASILLELFVFKSGAGLLLLIGKWFVFWCVGLRLFLAGLRQAISPRFTAEEIFGIKSQEPLPIVEELGFANLSIGILGLSSILNGAWVMPAAIAGGLFYGLAGIRHLLSKEKNFFTNSAMTSNLFVFALLLIYFVTTIAH